MAGAVARWTRGSHEERTIVPYEKALFETDDFTAGYPSGVIRRLRAGGTMDLAGRSGDVDNLHLF